MEQLGLDTTMLLLLTTAPMLVAFVVVLVLMLLARAGVLATRDWPQTIGRLQEVMLEEKLTRRGRRGAATRRRYLPRVRYAYEVAGHSFQGTWARRDDSMGYTVRRMAESAISPFQQPPGSLVTVYYNPDNPAEAVLSHEPGARTRTFGLAAVALLVGVGFDVLIIGVLLPRLLP